MKFLKLLASFLIALFITLPVEVLGLFLVPLGLKYGFKGWLWPWGNDDHPDNGGNFWNTKCGDTYWCAYQWFATRNPCFNFGKYVLGLTATGEYTVDGDPGIGDTKHEGKYWAKMGWAWEYYYVKAYTLFGKKKCIRFRAGWKLNNKAKGELCQCVFSPNPFMTYTGT